MGIELEACGERALAMAEAKHLSIFEQSLDPSSLFDVVAPAFFSKRRCTWRVIRT